MNLEHLCKIIKENWNQIDQKNALKVLKTQFELLAWKKNKLKLGAIAFEIKQITLENIIIWEEIEIRYIRQDTTLEDEQKLENILKRLGWKWDAKNVIAMVTVIITFTSYFIAHTRLLYYKYFPTLAFRADHFDYLIKFSFESTFSRGGFETFSNFNKFNFWLIDVLTDFCVCFDIIF